MHLNRTCGLTSALFSIALAACGGSSTNSQPQLQQHLSFMGGGDVQAIARGPDGTIYLGGYFTRASAVSGSGVPLDRISGQPKGAFPQVEGMLSAVVPDGKGGWYIGGSFRSVAGVERKNLAHLSSDLELDQAWATKVEGDVRALAVRDGHLLVGGAFTEIGGESRANLAELDSTGAVTGWDPSPNAAVNCLAVNGNTVYLGGAFTKVAGAARSSLAAVDSSGVLSAWRPSMDAWVFSLAIKGTSLYVGGDFTKVTSAGTTAARVGVAEFRLSDGALTAWSPDLVREGGGAPEVWALAVLGDTLFVGGTFTGVGSGMKRSGLAAFDASGSLIQDWYPSLESAFYPSVQALAASGSTLYVGGDFETVAGKPRHCAAAVDAKTGEVLGWDPRVDEEVEAIGVAGDTVYVGGMFNGLGGVQRNGLAALAPDGSLTSWDPNVSGIVNAILVEGDTIYVGGVFDTIGGQARRSLAAVDRSGAVLPWDPGSGGVVDALAAGSDAIYVAGSFREMGGAARTNLASVDRKGQVTAWNPVDVTGSASALLVSGTDVYCAGGRASSGSTPSTYSLYRYASTSSTPVWKAALSSGTAYALALAAQAQPQSDGTSKTVNVLYAGGSFQAVGAASQRYLAALEAQTGTPLASFAPTILGSVNAMTVADGTLYVGGSFSQVNGKSRIALAAFDLAGLLQSWNPALYSDGTARLNAVSAGPGVLDVGGSFDSLNGQLSGNYARVSR